MKIEDLIVGKKYKHTDGNFAFYAGKNQFDTPVFELEKHVGTTTSIPKNYKYVASNTYWAYISLEREFSPVEEDLKSLEVKEQSSDELLAEAKRWYPIGTKFKSVYNSEGPSSEVEVVNTDFSYEDSYLDDYGYVIQNHKTGGWLYSSVKGWAEIISKPETKTDHRYKFNVGEEFIVNFDSIDYSQHYQLGGTVAVIDRSEVPYFSSQSRDKAYYHWENLLTGSRFYTTENCTFTQNLTKVSEEKTIPATPSKPEEKYYMFREDLFPGCSQEYKAGTIVLGHFSEDICRYLSFTNNYGKIDGYSLYKEDVKVVTKKDYDNYQELWKAYLECCKNYKIGDKVESMHGAGIVTLIDNPKLLTNSISSDCTGSNGVVDLYFKGKYAKNITKEEIKDVKVASSGYINLGNLSTDPIELFPAKWYLNVSKLSDSQKSIVGEFYDKRCNSTCYNPLYGNISSHNVAGHYIGDDTMETLSPSFYGTKGKEISFEQFEIYVLKTKAIWRDSAWIDSMEPVKKDNHLELEHQEPVVVKSSKNKKSKLVII